MRGYRAYKYFRRYLKIAPLSLALWRSSEAVALSRHKLSKPVLDLGCGFGEFAGVFFSSQIEVGIDINSGEILRAAATGKYEKTFIADARKLPFKNNSFGSVISISTLEHIPDNAKVFKEAFRVLKPGGSFFFTVPTDKIFSGLLAVKIFNFFRLKSLAYIYYRIFNKVFKHVFIPCEKEWQRIAQKAGFRITKVQGTLSRSLLILFELGLLSALPSQIGKFFFGRRFVIAPELKLWLFRPFIKLIDTSTDFKANIFIVAQKPKN